VQGDIGDPATAENLVRAATDRWGRLDGLVNNAGCTVSVPLADLDSVGVEHWEKVLRTNVIGTFLVSQACLPLLRAAPESWIVNVTSLAGTRQTGSSFPYAVSKAAVNHMTTLLAKFVGSNVRVNGAAKLWARLASKTFAPEQTLDLRGRTVAEMDSAVADIADVPRPVATRAVRR
jgi:ketoreductase RED2